MVLQSGLPVCRLDLVGSRVFGNAQDGVRLNSRRLLIRECFSTGRHFVNCCEKSLGIDLSCGVGRLFVQGRGER